MNEKPQIQIQTYGCKVNTYDSGLLQKRFSEVDFFKGTEATNVFVFNTCAVTAEATLEAKREIRRFKSKNPNAKIVVTGCGAQVDTKQFDELTQADLIVANSHKGQIESLIDKLLRGEPIDRVHHSNIFRKEDLEEGGGLEEDHTRSFLKIQDGCNQFCTYCVIPFARGKSRSLSIPSLIDRVNELYSNGVQEVVLTGVHIGDYEDIDTLNNSKQLEDLIECILDFTKIPRVRLSSLEPIEVSQRLLNLFKSPRLCPHFHMSIQSANTRVLEAMRRKYTAEDVQASLIAIQQAVPNAFVGMDVIVGFPTETDEEFEDTYRRLSLLPWTRIHVFPYSERPGTKAIALEPKVKEHIIRERARKLRDLSSERFVKQANEQLGKVKSSLILRNPIQLGDKKLYQALTDDYWPVIFDQDPGQSDIVQIRIVAFDNSLKSRMDGRLIGELI